MKKQVLTIAGAMLAAIVLMTITPKAARAVTAALVDVVLAGADYLKTEVSRVEAMLGGAAPAEPASNAALLEKVRQLMSGKPAEPSTAPAPAAEVAGPESPAAEARKSDNTELLSTPSHPAGS